MRAWRLAPCVDVLKHDKKAPNRSVAQSCRRVYITTLCTRVLHRERRSRGIQNKNSYRMLKGSASNQRLQNSAKSGSIPFTAHCLRAVTNAIPGHAGVQQKLFAAFDDPHCCRLGLRWHVQQWDVHDMDPDVAAEFSGRSCSLLIARPHNRSGLANAHVSAPSRPLPI